MSDIPEELLDDITPEPSNPFLEEIIEKYDCEDLLPLARRIIRLSSIKEVVGYIPNDIIPFDYEELEYLLILSDEQNKKIAFDAYQTKKKFDDEQSKNSSLNSAEMLRN